MSLFSFSWRMMPLLLIVMAYVAARFGLLSFVDTEVLRAAPYLIASVLFAFAAMFNRTRFIAPILITVLSYLLIRNKLQLSLEQDSVMSMFVGLNLIFCSLLVLASVSPDKGLYNRTGFVFIAFFLFCFAMLWSYGGEADWLRILGFLPWQDLMLFADRYWLSSAVLIMHALTALVLLVGASIRRSPADYALLVTWVTGLLVFFDFAKPEVSSICFSALLLSMFLIFQQSNYRATYLDALTGIPGRRALDDYLATLGKKYAIAMLDVDHFKKFNDTYGHDVGDQVLKLVASKIAQVQGGGKAFRYGGEEFALVFHRKTAAEVFVFLEAVRESVAQYKMTLRADDRQPDPKSGKKQRGSARPAKDKTVSVTVSLGVANSEPGLSTKDIVKKADENLYRAKQAGRNCTIRPKD